MILLLFTYIILMLLILIVTWYINFYYKTWGIKTISGPPPVPLVGNALLLGNSETFLEVEQEVIKQYGKTSIFTIGFNLIIGTTDPKFIEYISTSQKLITKAKQYEFLHAWLGKGLLTSDGSKWRSRRKLLTPTYHFKILEQFIDVFEANTDIMLKQIQMHSSSKAFNIFPYISLCSLDIICETAMGTKVNAQLNKTSNYVESIKKMCEIIADRFYAPLQQLEWMFILSSKYQDQKRALKVIQDYSSSVIAEKRKILMNDLPSENVNEFGIKKRDAFLNVLLKTSMNVQYLSDADIQEEVDTFMFEGHDTVSTALGFICYCISTHPDVQQRLIEEQQLILGDKFDEKISYTNLQEMKYLEMVIKEALRLYPSVPFYGRQAIEDFEYDNMYIKKGTALQLFIYGLHRDADYYPDPEKFDPERFSFENQNKRNPFTYLAFSAGSRNCIGQKFAMLEMKTVLSKLFTRYQFLEAENYKPIVVGETILKSKNGIMVRIQERKY